MTSSFDRLFIFEMANNHQGSLTHGLKIVSEMQRIAQKYGINAGVKLQYRDLDTFIHPSQMQSKDNKHIARFLSTRLDAAQYGTLVNAIKDAGLRAICTPFDEKSVEVALNHGIEILKIASASANDWSLLEAVAEARKPTICSTGGLTLTQIDKVVSFFQHRNVEFALLHCVGIYPVRKEMVRANFIDKLRKRFFWVPIGYSGHEAPDEHDIVKVVVGKGARILERHVGVEAPGVSLNAYSLNPLQTDAWVKAALDAWTICSDSDDKRVSIEESDSLRSLMRGVYAARRIAKGEALTREAVQLAIPCAPDQTTAFDYHESMVASRDYQQGEQIAERRIVRERVDLIRSIVHELKGMLNEACIVPGQKVRIELSHHKGLEQFRRVGATLIEIVNRSYCKKLLVVLPGQNHPMHYHGTKEETFQLLWGELELQIDGKDAQVLRPGDSYLVEPGMRHSFGSKSGAIVEEISTAHVIGDSFYDDAEISKKDILERKTVITDW